MKTLTKKAMVLASAIAVAGTFAVCAATYGNNGDGVITPTLTDRSVSVAFTTDVAATDQITILAYNTALGATPDATNIVFIDQVQKDSTSGTISFSLRDDDGEGTYRVLMGGTGVTTAGSGEFIVAPAATNGTITGTVTSANTSVKPSITITGGEVNQTVFAGEDDTYSVAVPAGTYTVDLVQKGHIKRTVYDVAVTAGAPTAVSVTSLMPGDVNDDGAVEDTDLSLFNTSWYLMDGDAGFDQNADFNGDAAVEDTDLALFNSNWYFDSSLYN